MTRRNYEKICLKLKIVICALIVPIIIFVDLSLYDVKDVLLPRLNAIFKTVTTEIRQPLHICLGHQLFPTF